MTTEPDQAIAGDDEAEAHVPGRMKARVHVFPRPEILDPQGKALGSALSRLGFDEVAEVRAGKSFDISLKVESRSEAERSLERMCRQLLANLVIEDYSYELLTELEPRPESGGDGA